MRLRNPILLSAALAGLLSLSTNATAAEVCGDGLDNDSDGFADNGCYPVGVTGVCESPLSCAQTGAVAPDTGQLVYHEPPDIAPTVPYGPPITLRRQYMSQYEPGYNDPSDTDYTAPLGYGWHHNFMSWVKIDSGASDEVMLHSVSGQDVLFTRTSTAGGYDTYAPQVGFHFDYLRHKTNGSPSARIWELRTLSGQVYKYDTNEPIAKLTAIVDSVGNEIALTYYDTGCQDGQLKRVTDASGNKYIEFTYHSSTYDCTVDYVKYYAGGTERVEVDYDYYSGDNYELQYVYVGADPARLYDYDANHKLTSIDIRSGDYVADIYYITTSGKPAGKVARIETGRGVLGYEYGMQQKDCTRTGSDTTTGTCVYYHRKDTTACSADSGSYYCGGEQDPGTGTTGRYFRATRWLGYSTANEDLIDSVASSCTNCMDVAEYAWNTGTLGDALELLGLKSPETQYTNDVWTSYERNSDGLVIKMVENDSNSDATDTDPSGSRVNYYVYGNTTYPGLVTEVRRLSELKPTGTCDDPTDASPVITDCKRTIYAYTSAGLLDTIQEKGFTYNSSAATVAYDFTTDWDYDSLGRVTKYKGPRTDTSYDVTDYTYHATGALVEGYLKERKRQKASATFITTTIDDYDEWGNGKDIEDPNGDYTCLTFDADRNVLTKRRIAMNAQTSCATTHADDLTTEFTYDEALRLTQFKKPLGNCLHREYDAWGRVNKIMSRDDCDDQASGDSIEFAYTDTGTDATDDGLLVQVLYKGPSTTTYWKEMTYSEARRVSTMGFADVTGTEKTFAYEKDGQLSTVDDDGNGKTEWQHDEFGRRDLIKRFTGASTSDDWAISPGVQTDLPTQVSDPDSKAIDWVWDDLGRKVSQTTFESGITTYNYDKAGNLTLRIEDDGGSDEKSNSFSYDSLNRLTEADYGDADCFANGDAEIHYTYDTLTGCPTGTCVNGQGRLVKVETQLFCDDTETDDEFDQQTFYGYDYAGRMVAETIEDDASRSAVQTYAWDKNGNETQAVAPSGAEQNWVNGYSTSNSDTDKVYELKRDTTGITTAGTWMPFGPMESYRHYNKLNDTDGYIEAEFTWDVGYRPEVLQYKDASETNVFKISYGWDTSGNLIKKDYTGAHASVQDDHYLYDWLDRATCNDTAAGCTGTNKTNLTYNDSGDRTSVDQTAWARDAYTYDTTYVMDSSQETHQIDYAARTGLTVNYSHDGRGNRLYDDDDVYTVDRRDYTYDARNNLITVKGNIRSSLSTVDPYTMTNAFDHKNRRVFKSFLNKDTDVEAQWFFYYDASDRLFEIKYTPDISSSSTYSIYQFYWIGDRQIAAYQVNYPGATTTKRYVHSDHMQPLEMYSWSDRAVREWAINTNLFGWDIQLLWGAFQPIRFPGQYSDEETAVYVEVEPGKMRGMRPQLHDNRYRTFDPWTGTYLQVDPKVDSTWEAYNYVSQNPVMRVDPTGLIPAPSSGADYQPGNVYSDQFCSGIGWAGPTPFNSDPSSGGSLAGAFQDECTNWDPNPDGGWDGGDGWGDRNDLLDQLIGGYPFLRQQRCYKGWIECRNNFCIGGQQSGAQLEEGPCHRSDEDNERIRRYRNSVINIGLTDFVASDGYPMGMGPTNKCQECEELCNGILDRCQEDAWL